MAERETRPDKSPHGGGQSALARAAEPAENGVLMSIREWLDALIIAFVLAMFIRTFIVELFEIPSGSMSPTLLGDVVAEGQASDANGQPQFYLLIKDPHSDSVQIWRKGPSGRYVYDDTKWEGALTASQRVLFEREAHVEEHRIFVNKFAYWLSKPARGDIVVFRVPFKAKPTVYERNGRQFGVNRYERNKRVYVKRAVAFGGEKAEIGDDHRLYINGKLVTEPKAFQHLSYTDPDRASITQFREPPDYNITVPAGEVLVFGDNTRNSYDSRYWGGVPYENLRGKAFFRYWPLRKMSFLK